MNFNDFEFEKNKYFLKDLNNKNKMENLSKESCAENCINNDYDGFMYKGDDNKCLLFGNAHYTKKIDDHFLDSYKDIQSFIRTKDYKDVENIKDKLNYPKYFAESNNYYKFQPDDLLMEYSVLNKTECMEKCVDASPQCKSILYLDQPKECIFSKEKKMKSSRDNLPEYDIYTVKNKNGHGKNNKNKKIMNQEINDVVNEITHDMESCASSRLRQKSCASSRFLAKTELEDNNVDAKYTKCEKYDDADNLLTIKKAYNKSCKENFGDEYVFDDNVFDKKSVVRCNENDTLKVKCKMSYLDNNLDNDINFNDKNAIIEMFQNSDNKKSMERNQNIIYVAVFLILLILFIFCVVFMKC